MIAEENLRKFLVKAKMNTYALSGEGGENLLADGSKEFLFEESNFKYRDRYFGSTSFIGEEIVFENEKPIWGMNYYGGIISKSVAEKEVYEFLKEALRNVTTEKPFRGPESFKKDDFKYINKVDGNIEKFFGKETISYKNQPVYKLIYQGGLIE